MTPFGAAVDPDVYCRNAIESAADGTGAKAGSGSGAAGSSTGSQYTGAPTCPSLGSTALGSTALASSSMAMVLSTAAGSQSRTMPRAAAASLPCLGGFTGTAMTPAYRQAKNATMKSRPGG